MRDQGDVGSGLAREFFLRIPPGRGGVGGSTLWWTQHFGSEQDLWTPCFPNPRGRHTEFPFLEREQRGDVFYLEVGCRRCLVEVLASISPLSPDSEAFWDSSEFAFLFFPLKAIYEMLYLLSESWKTDSLLFPVDSVFKVVFQKNVV